MTKFIRIPSIATAVALGSLIFAGSASAYNVTVDQFTIYKNGNLYVNDEFNDGNAPPASGSNFGTGTTPATYFTSGTWTENGGKAIADSTNNPQVIQSAYSSSTVNRHDARLNSSMSDTNTTIGLRDNDSFYAMALFDLSSVLDKNESSYNLRFRDTGSGNPVNDEARIGVRRNSSGDMSVRFGDFDLDAGTFNILDSDTLLAGDQILLRLDNDGSGFATGSYAYVNGGIDLANAAAVGALGFTQMAGSVELFSDNDWTRASLSVFENIDVPEPGLAVLFGLGFAGLVWQRRRRQI